MIQDTQRAQILILQDQDEQKVCVHENNVPCRLLLQWLCGYSCTWGHNVQLYIAGTDEPKSSQQAKQGACIMCLSARVAAKLLW